MAKKPKKYSLYTRLAAAIRDEWRRSPQRYAIVKAARVAPGTFLCAGCKKSFKEKLGGKSQYRVDHIEPVVPLTGFLNWDDYITRMFTGAQQMLCLECSATKTKAENVWRRKVKASCLAERNLFAPPESASAELP